MVCCGWPISRAATVPASAGVSLGEPEPIDVGEAFVIGRTTLRVLRP